ncbi:MAG: hypothetical protein EOO38_02510 [Cytophagaceae bacterium]|nr:MAG: hypothetical protein EOO38_02510 [Cytophagaceae bacterium]
MALSEIDNSLNLWPLMKAAATNEAFLVATKLNPFKDKTVAQCQDTLRKLGFVENPKAPDHEIGLNWVRHASENPRQSKRSAFIDEGGAYKEGYEPPHVDITCPKPNRRLTRNKFGKDGTTVTERKEVKLTKIKYPIDPTSKEWGTMTQSLKLRYSLHEASRGRSTELSARTVVPSMQKGGVEFSLAPLDSMDLYPNLIIHFQKLNNASTIPSEEFNQILRELFLGIYICDEYPSLAMDPVDADSTIVSVPPVYQRTLVSETMKNIDAFGKGVLQGMVLPEEGRQSLIEEWHERVAAQGDYRSGKVDRENYAELLQLYKEYGGRLLYDNSADALDLEKTSNDLARALKESNAGPTNYTFVPNVVLVEQLDSRIVPKVDIHIGGDIQFSDGLEVNKNAQERAWACHAKHADAILRIMLKSPEIAHDLERFKMIGFCVHLLVTLKKKNLMPDLTKLQGALITYPLEDLMPPFLKPATERDSTWYLHGETRVNLAHVPVAAMPAEKIPALLNAPSTLLHGVAQFERFDLPIVATVPGKRVPEWLFDMQENYTQARSSLESIRAIALDKKDERLYDWFLELYKWPNNFRGLYWDENTCQPSKEAFFAAFRQTNEHAFPWLRGYGLWWQNPPSAHEPRHKEYIGGVCDAFGRSIIYHAIRGTPLPSCFLVNLVRTAPEKENIRSEVASQIVPHFENKIADLGLCPQRVLYWSQTLADALVRYDSPGRTSRQLRCLEEARDAGENSIARLLITDMLLIDADPKWVQFQSSVLAYSFSTELEMLDKFLFETIHTHRKIEFARACFLALFTAYQGCVRDTLGATNADLMKMYLQYESLRFGTRGRLWGLLKQGLTGGRVNGHYIEQIVLRPDQVFFGSSPWMNGIPDQEVAEVLEAAVKSTVEFETNKRSGNPYIGLPVNLKDIAPVMEILGFSATLLPNGGCEVARLLAFNNDHVNLEKLFALGLDGKRFAIESSPLHSAIHGYFQPYDCFSELQDRLLKTLQTCVAHGVPVGHRNHLGQTAIELTSGHWFITKALVALGAEPLPWSSCAVS